MYLNEEDEDPFTSKFRFNKRGKIRVDREAFTLKPASRGKEIPDPVAMDTSDALVIPVPTARGHKRPAQEISLDNKSHRKREYDEIEPVKIRKEPGPPKKKSVSEDLTIYWGKTPEEEIDEGIHAIGKDLTITSEIVEDVVDEAVHESLAHPEKVLDPNYLIGDWMHKRKHKQD
ncbi:MAG: hypothetical protein [Avonheates virus SG2_28]|nr:MAG: hypothetical protein [Avonheates virus SG2_28]